MAEIVPFPSGRAFGDTLRAQPGAARGGREEDEHRKAREQHLRQAEELQDYLDQLPGTPKGGVKIAKAADRAQIARNLDTILKDLHRSRGISRLAVLDAAGLAGGAEESTKKLYNYTLPDGLSKEKDGRAAKLSAKLGKYIRIAEGAAAKAGREKNWYLPELLRDTSFVPRHAVSEDERAWLPQVRDLLRGAARSAIRQNDDMKGYSDTLSCGYLGWHISRGFGVFDSLRSGGEPVVIRDRANIWTRYLGFVPTVHLYDERLGSIDVEVPVYRDSDLGEALRGIAGGLEGSQSQEQYESLLETSRSMVTVSVVREVRIGLALFGEERSWEPCFEKRLAYRFSTTEHSFSTYEFQFEPAYNLGHEPAVLAPDTYTIGDAGTPDYLRVGLSSDLKEKLPLDPDFLDERGDFDMSCFRYEIVDLPSCKKYLGSMTEERLDRITLGDWWRNKTDEFLLSDRWLDDEWMYPSGIAPCLSSPPGSIARAVEQNMLYEIEPAFRLDNRLFTAVRSKVSAALTQKLVVSAARVEQLNKLRQKWEAVERSGS